MVLDTSALVALLLDEPEAETFRAAVEEDTTRLVSAAHCSRRPSSSRHERGNPAGVVMWPRRLTDTQAADGLASTRARRCRSCA